MRSKLQTLVHSDPFDYFMTSIIFINAILIGVEFTYNSSIISFIQSSCLVIFIIEIFLRWMGRYSVYEYVSNGWNWYDIIIVIVSLIPEDCFSNAEMVSALRILRVFRVLRVFKAIPSMRLMARVLITSIKSLFQATFFLLIFMYMYALIGVILFEGETVVSASSGKDIDPYGSIGEAFFSLFRITTGEDWTDLRYNLMHKNAWLVNIYHVSWMILSSFLLLNIIVGAIVNNYEKQSNEEDCVGTDNKLDLLIKKIEELEVQVEAATKRNWLYENRFAIKP